MFYKRYVYFGNVAHSKNSLKRGITSPFFLVITAQSHCERSEAIPHKKLNNTNLNIQSLKKL